MTDLPDPTTIGAARKQPDRTQWETAINSELDSLISRQVFGQITNISEHINDIRQKKDELVESIAINYDQFLAEGMRQEINKKIDVQFPVKPETDPLKTQLGYHRILRTSPLVAVPEICCIDC